jgi:glycosyltransferase involved in cell wall biosynthesis
MLSVVIAAHDDGRKLVATLATLVPGAIAGLIREVIVADRGSREVVEIAEAAGCRHIESRAPTGTQIRSAAAAARGPWLLFLKPGCVLEPSWIGETRGFIDSNDIAGRSDKIAAVFRRAPAAGAARPAVMEALWLLTSALGARPRPEQGLLISKRFYERLGGHGKAEDAESDMLRRLGRRHIVMLRSTATATRP